MEGGKLKKSVTGMLDQFAKMLQYFLKGGFEIDNTCDPSEGKSWETNW